MSEWIEWNGGEMPVCGSTRVTVRWRSGEIMTNRASKFEWTRNGFGDDVFAYKILEEEPKGHPNAAILMEIAKEAAINPEYWKEFEFKSVKNDRWEDCSDAIMYALYMGYPVRRKPRTIRIGNYDVPEFLGVYIGHGGAASTFPTIVSIKFEDGRKAELMLKALQELLAGKQ